MIIFKKTISYLLAFVLGIILLFEIILLFLNDSLLSEMNMQIELKNTNYYYNIYSIILNTAKDYVMQSGFHEIVLDDVITEKRTQNDLNHAIHCLYNNKKVEINTSDLREKLSKNIKKQIEIKNYEIDNQTQNAINEFEDSIINEYKSNMYYSEEIANQIGTYIPKISQIVLATIIILAIIIIILLIILYKLNKPSIGIGFIISGIICILVKIYSGTNIVINNILILNWAFSQTMIHIMNILVQKIFMTGIVFTSLGFLTILLCEYDISKKFYKNKKKKRASDGK